MKLKNRRMLSVLMAIIMVLTMMPFHPLKVRAAAATTLNLGTPVRCIRNNLSAIKCCIWKHRCR